MNSEPHVLVFRTDRIGDLILSLPLAEAVKRAVPAARVTYCVQRPLEALARMSPFVDGTIGIGGRDLDPADGDFREVLATLQPDIAFFAYPRPKLAFAVARARVRLRVGTAYRWYSPLFTHKVREHRKKAARHERDYTLALAERLGMPVRPLPDPKLVVPQDASAAAEVFLEEHGIGHETRFVVVHPGSGGSAKDWDAENFGLLARALSVHDPRLVILVSGTESEKQLMTRAAAASENARIFQRHLTLPELAAVYARAALFAANSTGPLHLAAAVGTPVLGLYPFERVCNPRRWGPLGARARVLTPDVERGCAACRAESCARHDVMARITVDRAIEAAVSLLG